MLNSGEGLAGKVVEPLAAYILFTTITLHTAFFWFVVRWSAVKEASNLYGRQLVVTIEALAHET